MVSAALRGNPALTRLRSTLSKVAAGKVWLLAAAGLAALIAAGLLGLKLRQPPSPSQQVVVVPIPAAATGDAAAAAEQAGVTPRPAPEPGSSKPQVPTTASASAPAAPPQPDVAISGPPAPAPAPAIIALSPAPDPDLVEKTPDGPLPALGHDGRQPWIVYARPFDAGDRRPRVAIVIGQLGPSKIPSQDAVQNLPPETTLSFLPYHPVADLLQQARRLGHETMLDLPMEPLDYPREDPGPKALLVALEPRQNLDRLHWLMTRGTGYIGLMTYMGSRFDATPDQLRPVLAELKQRGLAFLDAGRSGDDIAPKLGAELGLPRGLADRVIDADASRTAIEAQLAQLEDLARRGGSAVGVGQPYPVTIETVAAWASHLPDHGIALAPLSAVLAR
ncbi:MAG: divergent polysaccharide deacetylase family protein [Alphaproteobacteria bacterium]|nr:divergent polysaccharide deacetylase family protein [Alphaproteobacteria bacterium]